MHQWHRRAALAALAALALWVGTAAESRAQFTRRNPFVEAVEKTRPSIVTIKVEKKGNWGRKDVVGTGVIIDERGYVVTNCHVVAGSERLSVQLADGGDAAAQIYAEDTGHDLAILRVRASKKLKALPIGPGTDLLVGETVMAVGHPYGYTNTVSTGIISALGREITMPSSGAVLKDLIQTNTSINPGNSGGPLMNINGELIGINVALREGAQGIAFAINADTVQQVLARHLSAARIAGVRHGLVCREKVVSEEGPARQQLVVERVAEKSPAARAGLTRGDVIVKVGELPTGNRFDLERALWGCKAGEKVEATILREGKETRLSLKLAGAADAVTAVADEMEKPGAGGRAKPAATRD